MEIILSSIAFISYFMCGTIVIYYVSNDNDRSYNNAFAGLMAILLWPLLLIYKIYLKSKQLFITLTNTKNKTK